MEEKKYLVIDGKKTKIIDLIGRSFGKLMVVEFDEESYKEDIIRKFNKEINKIYPKWICTCECGNRNIVVLGINLKNGNTKSCGCLADKSINLMGLKFGRLTVIERSYINKNKQRAYWNCMCECENIISVASDKLISGHTQSCGCLRKENVSKAITQRAIIKNGSFGEWVNKNISKDFIDLYWSKTNIVNPFEIASMGNVFKVKIICDKCNEEYSVYPNHFISHSSRCPICTKSKGELKIQTLLNTYNIIYEGQREFDGLLGVGNGLLSYDFYLKKHNLLIEYQGQFHDGSAKLQTDEEYRIQLEHDRRKREYAKNNNIELLEIWYWDFDNIKDILIEKLNIS